MILLMGLFFMTVAILSRNILRATGGELCGGMFKKEPQNSFFYNDQVKNIPLSELPFPARDIEKLEKQFETELGVLKDQWSAEAINAFRDRISDMAKSNYFGFDINPDLVKATKMNMVMNNDGSGNILQTNSLLPPHEWTDDFRSDLAEALGIDKASIRNYKTIEFLM